MDRAWCLRRASWPDYILYEMVFEHADCSVSVDSTDFPHAHARGLSIALRENTIGAFLGPAFRIGVRAHSSFQQRCPVEHEAQLVIAGSKC